MKKQLTLKQLIDERKKAADKIKKALAAKTYDPDRYKRLVKKYHNIDGMIKDKKKQ